MNVDEIVDKKTCYWPGPIGKQGPQGVPGVPGVNAVPADEAVAAYINAESSKTTAALMAWRPPVNIVDYGADPTGKSDTSELINGLLGAGTNVIIPPGKYLIAKPLSLRYASVCGTPGSTTIIANAPMDYMLDLGDIEFYEKKCVTGIRLDCNNMASTGTINGKQSWVEDVTVLNPTSTGIDGSNAQGMRLDRCYVVKDVANTDTTVTGIIVSNDCVCGSLTCFGCEVGVDFVGVNSQVSNIYVWSGGNSNQVVGIRIPKNGNINIGNLYLDTQNIGVKSGGASITCNGITVYNMSTDANDHEYMLLDVPWGVVVTAGTVDLDGTITPGQIKLPSNQPKLVCATLFARGPFAGSYYDNKVFTIKRAEFYPLTSFTGGTWYKFGHVEVNQQWVGLSMLISTPRLEKAVRVYFDFDGSTILFERYLGKNANGISVGFSKTADGEYDLFIASDADAVFEFSFFVEHASERINAVYLPKRYTSVALPANAKTQLLTSS